MHQNFTFNVNRYNYHCCQSGSGSPVVLAHCSGSNHKQWKILTTQLQHQYKVLAPDFLGYGNSDSFNGWASHDAPDATALEQLISKQSEPVHLIGHSYGGAMALMATLNIPYKIRSLTLIEPVTFNVLRETYDWQQRHQICSVADRIISLTQRQQNKQAACEFVQYWHSRIAWWLMPKALKTRLQKAMPKIAAEFHLMYTHYASSEALQTLKMPVHLLCGSKTTEEAKAVVHALDELIPDTHLSVLTNCGHLAAATHPQKVNPAILHWLQSLQSIDAGTNTANLTVNYCATS